MLRGTFYLGLSQVVSVLTGFFLQLYLGRTLGPEQYGIFGIINAFIMINEIILMKGVYDTISKFVAEKEEATNAIVSTVFKAMAIMGFALGGIYFLLAAEIASLMNDPELEVYLKIFSFIIPFSALSTVYFGALNGLRQFGRQALIFILFYIVRVILVIILVFSGYSVKGVIIGLLMTDILRLAMARGFYKPIWTDVEFDRKKMFSFALQLIIISLFSTLVMYIDLFAVKTFVKRNFETGLYTSAMTIAKIPTFLIMPITITLLPVISKLISANNTLLTEKQIKQSLRLVMITVLPISLMIIATSENCLSFFYGHEYVQSSNALKILVVGGVFLSIKALMYSVIVASGYPRYIIYVGILSLLIEIIFLVPLISRIGIIGAAIASTATHFFGFLISYGYVARRFMVHMISFSLIRIILASLVVYFIANIYSPHGIMLLFYYGLLLCLYFYILIMIKEINLKEMRLKISETREMTRLRDIAARYLR